MRRTETPKEIWITFCMVVDIADLVTYTYFGDNRLRGFWVAGGQISPPPIDFHRRPYNTLALPCERVISWEIELLFKLQNTTGRRVTTSHAHTVVWECCKDDQQSQWEMLKFDPQLPLNHLSDRHQIWHAWLRRPNGYLSPRKNWAQSVKGFLLPIYAKYTPPMFGTLRYPIPIYACLLLFWYFQSPTAETPAWILTLKTLNDAVLSQGSAFWGL